MIKLTKEELSKIKPLNNMVIIKPLENRSKYQLTKDVELKLDVDFTEQAFRYIGVINKVIAVPDKIIFGQGGSEWETTMELSVDDTVVVNYFPLQPSVTSGDFIVCEGEIYYYIRYSDIYCKSNEIDDKVHGLTLNDGGVNCMFWGGKLNNFILIPLNGYLLCEPVFKKEGIGAYSVEKETNSAIVKFIGSKNTRHFEEIYKPESVSSYIAEDRDVEVGDVIFYKQFLAATLDNGLKNVLGDLRVIKRSDVVYLKRGEVIYA